MRGGTAIACLMVAYGIAGAAFFHGGMSALWAALTAVNAAIAVARSR